jgi:hypothetical protein
MKPRFLLLCCFLSIEVAKFGSSLWPMLLVNAADSSDESVSTFDPDVPTDRQLQTTYNGRVTALHLIHADTNQAVLTIINGTVIDVADFMTKNFNIHALTNEAVGSVQWAVTCHSNASNETTGYEHIDSLSPFMLCPSFACSILATPGICTVSATTFASPDALGVAGPSWRVTFHIVNSCKTPKVCRRRLLWLLLCCLFYVQTALSYLFHHLFHHGIVVLLVSGSNMDQLQSRLPHARH